MVKVAFIVEGKIEKIFIDFLTQIEWFKKYNIEKVAPTIDAKGGGNLCPKNIENLIEQVIPFNPDKIFILTDLECDPCVEKTKERLGDCDICVTVLARKAIEAWFLANDIILKKYTDEGESHFELPEKTEDMPYDVLKNLIYENTGRGISKVKLATSIFRNGFDIEESASHPNCPSAKYFVDKIRMIGEG